MVLRRRCESGEEVAVSALLGAESSNENVKFPREAFMKVGVKKPGLSSVLEFDCVATAQAGDVCNFEIQNVNYIPSSALDSSAFKGPSFRYFCPLKQCHTIFSLGNWELSFGLISLLQLVILILFSKSGRTVWCFF